MSKRATEDIIDSQNRDYHDRLASKASFLKGIAYDMEMEAKDHNKLLGGVDDDFDSAKGLLGGTMNRLNQMVGKNRNNRRFLMYVSLGVVSLFVLLYLIISKFSGR